MNASTQESLQATLNLIPAHTWYTDPSGALVFVNERCANYLGLANDDPLRFGKVRGAAWDSHIALLHPDDHDETRKAWSACIDSGIAGEVTFRVRSAEGGYRWFLSRAEPLMSATGAIQGWIGININIEERKQAEFYLAEGQRLGRSGSWAFNETGFQYWSSGLFQIYGLEPGGKAPSISEYMGLVHPEDQGFVANHIEKVLAEQKAFDFMKRVVRPDGGIRFIRCVGVPVSDGVAGRGFVGTGIDVTEQELLMQELRKSEEEFRQIVDLTPQLVAVLGPGGERLYANRMALSYVGISLDEWLRGTLGAQIHPDDRERQATFFAERLLDESAAEIEVRLPNTDGYYRWFLARFSPVRDDQGHLHRWYIACTDIDERKKAEERLQHENVALREEIEKTSMFEEIVGTSRALADVLGRVSKVAASDSTVLITGETGTGKELVARAIHRQSRRSSRAFVAVNCAAIPRELVASELFGHEKGAFTGALQRRLGRFELADGGTIFLDEVGELSPETQASLLRMLQEREFERVGGGETIQVDVRVITATNRDLEEAVADGFFRRDLFYRLNVFPVEVPPLRERADDIPLLVEYFIDRYARKMGKAFRHINRRTLDRLKSYPWPGNVRELQNVIERSAIVCDSEEFTIDDSWLSTSPKFDSRIVLPTTLATHEKVIIEDALRECGGRVFGHGGAAARLGIPRSTLESKIRSLRIDKSRYRQGTVKS
ncbi:Formate hydrogenlyase transcriptional activator [Dyella sp. AD56]|uniref:sigma 54-interacting transcriptional regulator n=1 Tax=Dyella sp. AD56 TaxID=1528744 RepID=UPI000CC1B774|nr:sigma 54-interacting transcriptional regulator [Dyella sp. AD56]PMQ04630.1 Formate hydrogenlyase transcriptional activator [Dyella sp. AD56]